MFVETINKCIMEEITLTTEFNKRLALFEESLILYRATGNLGSLIPRLFHLASYCWCKSPLKRKNKRS